MKFKNELEIDVGRCIRALGKKWKFILLITVLFTCIGVLLTLDEKEDLYTSYATVYSAGSGSYQISMTGTTAMNDYSDVCSSYKVCERAALLMGYEDIDGTVVMKSINVSTPSSSSGSSVASSYLKNNAALVKVTATTNNPTISMEMANAVAKAFVMEMEDIIGADVVKLLDESHDYDLSFNGGRHNWKIRILAFLAGFAVGCFVVVFFEIFDGKTRTIRECSIRNELPIIGVIPEYKK